MIEIKLKSFGVFSDFIGADFVVLTLETNITLVCLRKIIAEKFKFSENIKNLLDSSVFSNDSDILSDDYILSNKDVIYLLPPVSGG